MRVIRWVVFVCLVVVGAPQARAHEEHEHQDKMAMPAVPKPSAEMERIKALAGRWEGSTKDGDGEAQPAVVEYQVTSGGSAVVETLFPGTPHEMVSVYHDQGGKLAMTHYCMLGNQPNLKLAGSDPQHINLELADSPGIDPTKDQHMHGLTVAWQDADHLTQTWSCYEGGAQHKTTTITLARATAH